MTLRLTEAELSAIRKRQESFAHRLADASLLKHQVQRASSAPKPHHERTKSKNGLEAMFAAHLEERKQAGEIVWYGYEPFRIRLADGCFYRPDFVAVDKDGRTEVYEVKGFMREAARIRLKVAVEKLPYPFFLVRKHKGELKVTKV